VATGEASGLDCLDIDAEGIGWYDRKFDALPFIQAHETRSGGAHLLFKHAEGLRCSTGKIAPGVDVRADVGYIIWWPREELPFEDHPLCEWPRWLLSLAMAPKRKVQTSDGANRRIKVHRSRLKSLIGVKRLCERAKSNVDGFDRFDKYKWPTIYMSQGL
jgi:hypothetical protein